MKKSLTIIVIIILLTLTLFSCNLGSSNGTKPKGTLEFELNYNNEGYVVVGSGTYNNKHVEIPSEYKGLPVIGIGSEAFASCEWIESIDMPDSITEIGSSAFVGCVKLKSINIPNHVENLEGAFAGCEALETVTLPQGLIFIGDHTFQGCISLKEIVIPQTVEFIGRAAFAECESLYAIDIPDSVTDIKEMAFASCISLKKITISKYVRNIESKAFENCSSLESIDVSEDNPYYKSIDGCLYSKNSDTLIQYAPGKTEADFIIPSEVMSIAPSAFKGSSYLVSIEIPSSVVEIGDEAFSGCLELESVSIPDSIKVIDKFLFYDCISLVDVEFPAALEKINNYAFASCQSLKNIKLPTTLKSIGMGAFYGCISLEEISIHSNVEQIDTYAFKECSGLKTITIAYGLKEIGREAFSGCTSVAEIGIPNSVISIDYSAFSYCTGITRMTIPASIEYIGSYVFQKCDSLEWIEVSSQNAHYCSIDGNLYNKNATILMQYATGRDDEEFDIPNSVTSIEYNAIASSKIKKINYDGTVSQWKNIQKDQYWNILMNGNCQIYCTDGKIDMSGKVSGLNDPENLEPSVENASQGLDFTLYGDTWCLTGLGFCTDEHIVIPDVYENRYVTDIAPEAFWGADFVTGITIPNTITKLMPGTLDGARSLKNLVFMDNSQITALPDKFLQSFKQIKSVDFGNNSSIRNFGTDTFTFCESLESIDFGDNSLLTSFDGDMFVGCTSLTSINFGDNSLITEIPNYAFAGFDKLKNVDFGANSKLVYIGDNAFSNTAIESISLPESLKTIGVSSFAQCRELKSISIGSGLINIYGAAFAECSSLERFEVDASNAKFTAIDGNLYTKDKKTLVQYAIGRDEVSFTIPSNVSVIGERAFSGSSLKEIIMPESLVTIGNGAFINCTRLETITIPASVNNIGAVAFVYSNTSVVFEDPYGWWVATNVNATQGTKIDAESLSDPEQAAEYLCLEYYDYYWKKGK